MTELSRQSKLNGMASSAKKVILIGALGYFVDIYDLVLFSIVRLQSLRAIGVSEDRLLAVGVTLLNAQMLGMLVGGLLWGILGDRRGRVSVLFGSILLYSLGNLLNAFVQTELQYLILRFISGIGLAGELGAAITLVSEAMPKETRGFGTALVAGVGLSGAVFGGFVAEWLNWRYCYIVGGLMGIFLLVLRLRILDSEIFDRVRKDHTIKKGDFFLIFKKKERALRYLYGIGIGVPIWYVVGILVTFCPEIGKALHIETPLSPAKGIFYCYIGISIGDVLSGLLSQWLKSRKKVIFICLSLEAWLVFGLFFTPYHSPELYYFFCALLGLVTGYWAVFVTVAAEQFGTNLRATVATSTPNFVRGSVTLLTLSFEYLRNAYGTTQSALIVGVVAIALGFYALSQLQETFHLDLNYLENA